MSFIPKLLSKFATPKEFDNDGMVVRALSFSVLTVQQITNSDGRPPKFLPVDGFVRRFAFEQQNEDGDWIQRQLDINSPSFQRDLQDSDMGPGSLGRLKRTIKPDRKAVWTWEKLDE